MLIAALARSHTHGNFARSKTVEEGSEEWWASEKAKKLSPKRFDASDIKFKKVTVKKTLFILFLRLIDLFVMYYSR